MVYSHRQEEREVLTVPYFADKEEGWSIVYCADDYYGWPLILYVITVG